MLPQVTARHPVCRDDGDEEERSVRVLVVDDDAAVCSSIDRALRLEGYDVVTASAGGTALEALALSPPDALVLDLQLPDIDGLEVCRRMRAAGDDTPVLMLTARDAVDDRVAGLDAGADDYLVKPFALAELLARLRALLRRRAGADGEVLRLGSLSLDPATREGHRSERAFTLTRIEYDLLELFLRHPRQVLTREVILDRVWGYSFDSTTNSLAVYIGYLRRKTEAGGEPRCLHTVRGVGYVLRDA
jgi:two-component system response regulator MprA